MKVWEPEICKFIAQVRNHFFARSVNWIMYQIVFCCKYHENELKLTNNTLILYYTLYIRWQTMAIYQLWKWSPDKGQLLVLWWGPRCSASPSVLYLLVSLQAGFPQDIHMDEAGHVAHTALDALVGAVRLHPQTLNVLKFQMIGTVLGQMSTS